MIQIYHNPRCRKSREALAILQGQNQPFEIIEYLKKSPSKDELRSVIEKLGIKPLDLIRKGETIYKEKYKGQELSDNEWVEVMVENPILIERPIVVKGTKAAVGRPPENVLDLIKN